MIPEGTCYFKIWGSHVQKSGEYYPMRCDIVSYKSADVSEEHGSVSQANNRQPARAVKVYEVRSSETSVNVYHTTRYNIPEDLSFSHAQKPDIGLYPVSSEFLLFHIQNQEFKHVTYKTLVILQF
jgi:hypothetical protein